MPIQQEIDDILRFLFWHKYTQPWINPDVPFNHVKQYMLILSQYEQLDTLQNALEMGYDTIEWDG